MPVLPTLKLGIVDTAAMPADKSQATTPYHDWTTKPSSLRGNPNNVWRPLTAEPGSHVVTLQQQLQMLGFNPKGANDGIFGY